jgi:hypothetical protein
MAEKLNGRAIQTNSIPADRITAGTITLDQCDATIDNFVNDGGRPFIRSITYFGANTTASPSGGQTVTLNGSNFAPNVQVYINTSSNFLAFASAVSRINANAVSFTTPGRESGTYLLYAINPDGGFAILVPGIVYA